MRYPRFTVQIMTAVSLCVTLPYGLSAADEHGTRAASAAEFHSYRLTHGSPAAARRMLTDLLGDDAAQTQIAADEEQATLLVSGPPAVHQLARQLIQQLNSAPAPAAPSAAPPATPPLQVRTYSTTADQLERQAQLLKASLSPAARISLDRSGSRIIVAAPPADQSLAAQLLSAGTATARPLFPTAADWMAEPGSQPTPARPATDPFELPLAAPAASAAPSPSTLPRLPALDGPPATSLSAAQSSARGATADRVLRFSFRNISAAQAEQALQRLLGSRLVELKPHRLNFSAGRSRSLELSFDELSQSCLLTGSSDLVVQFATLLQQCDDARDQNSTAAVRFVPLNNIDPTVLNQALQLWRQAASRRAAPANSGAPQGEQVPGAADHGAVSSQPVPVRPAAFRQIPGQSAVPAGTGSQSEAAPAGSPQDQAGQAPEQPQDGLRRPSSDVTVEPLPDLDVLILRGRDPDVEELTRIIQEIERLSAETAPEIDVVYLQHVQGEALNELISDVMEDLTGPLQGRVSITPLVKPNALLLIGWGEAVDAARRLITRLDEAVPSQTQMQIYSLKHAPAQQVEATITEFLNNRGGLGPNVTITSDTRTNTVIVNAAPRDIQEVTRLIQKLDAGTSASVNQARIVTLQNALAADVAATITSAITAARGGTGGQRSAALEVLTVGPDGRQVVASGLLDDVKLTPDPRTNRIFLTGPADSLPLAESLIRSLDESPAASAQIKVFQITNGDASDLVLVLRSLFPEQPGASTVPQLATAEGESSLVPVRFSVDVRTNSIIATGTAGDLRIIEVLLLRLDETDAHERVNQVYRLKNSPALDVANAVNNFLRSERVVSQAAPGRVNPFTQIESEVVVVPEPVGNTLIISATPRYFDQIMDLVEGLDAQPPQVMIQVILAEVELDNLHEFGVELGLQDSLLFDRSLLGSILVPGFDFNNRPLGNANTPPSLASAGKVGGQALSHFSLGRTNSETDFGGLVLSASSENISVLLRALDQTRNMEILSRPQIMTLDNQPAFIQVGQRVPRIVGTSINQVGQVNSVELENVGLILGVTPRISPEGMVVMEIDAEKSEVGPEAEGIPVSVSADGEVIRSPRVDITTAQTTVSAASGQTIVIGGLITTSNSSVSRRVPWLSDVPIVGNFFRFDGNRNVRKELLIILTPHVVRGPSEAEYLKQVEMARMSWISCDIFNWMNTDSPITGQLDSSGVPTIFPDQTPSVRSLESMSTDEGSDAGLNNGPFREQPPARLEQAPPPAPDAAVPEIPPNNGFNGDADAAPDSGIQQMSYRTTNGRPSTGSSRKSATAAPRSTVTQPRPSVTRSGSAKNTAATANEAAAAETIEPSQSSSPSSPKRFWSLR